MLRDPRERLLTANQLLRYSQLFHYHEVKIIMCVRYDASKIKYAFFFYLSQLSSLNVVEAIKHIHRLSHMLLWFIATVILHKASQVAKNLQPPLPVDQNSVWLLGEVRALAVCKLSGPKLFTIR